MRTDHAATPLTLGHEEMSQTLNYVDRILKAEKAASRCVKPVVRVQFDTDHQLAMQSKALFKSMQTLGQFASRSTSAVIDGQASTVPFPPSRTERICNATESLDLVRGCISYEEYPA